LKFADQHTSSEDFPSADPLPQSVVGKVEKPITSAPPPLSTIGYFVDVADGNEVPLPEKKGILILCDCYRNHEFISYVSIQMCLFSQLTYSSYCLCT
jgi:hypothetical protein